MQLWGGAHGPAHSLSTLAVIMRLGLNRSLEWTRACQCISWRHRLGCLRPVKPSYNSTSKEPVCPRVELIIKIIIILLIIFLGFIKSKPC